MTIREVSLRGVKRRKSSGTDYFEARIPGHPSFGKFYCTKIKSPEEGALCYDFLQRYSELEVVGKKRKAAVKMNYPEYSRSVQLEPLPSDFDIRIHKEEAMEIILKQAQAAAKSLPASLRRSTPSVGSPRPSNRSSSHQNVHGKPLVVKPDLSGVCTNQLNPQEIIELVHQCIMSHTSKVIEKRELERQVADINENSGIIYPPESCPDDFTYSMACLEQFLESVEQGYKSLDSQCLKLRKILADHNLKVIDECLTGDDNDSSGRQRANESERPPRLPEESPSGEQNECGVSFLASDGYGPSENPHTGGRPIGTDRTTPPAVLGVSQCAVPQVEDRCDPEIPISQLSSDAWIYNLY